MTRTSKIVALLAAFTMVAAACGDDGSTETTSPQTTTSAAPTTTGGDAVTTTIADGAPIVLRTTDDVTSQGPWYVYDKSTCSFVETDDHPAVYVSELKLTPGLRLAYTPEGTLNEFDQNLNAAVEAAAAEAEIEFSQFSNEFPDTELPLQVVDQAIVVQAEVGISANVHADLYPQIQAKYEGECIPFLNMFAVPGTVGVPRFQSDNFVTGAAEAEAAAQIITERGWSLSEIRIVTCTDPAVTTEPGTVYDINVGFRETLVDLLGLSPDQIEGTDLVCTFELGAEVARQSMADWLTANPDVRHVVGTTHIDDLYSVGLANALRDAGYGDRALVAGRGGGTAALEWIASDDPILAVSGNPNFTAWGVPIVSMAQDIALGRPVPFLVSAPVAVVTAENVSSALGG